MTNDEARSGKLRSFLKAESETLGFEALGIVSADGHDEFPDRLQTFLDHGRHGSMIWMEETFARRADPKVLWPDAKSIVFLAMNYGPDNDPLAVLEESQNGAVSVYARHRDYHDIIKGRLKTLASKLVSRAKELDADCDVKVFVDTAPIMEKPLAAKAGLGWQGKHTNLVSRELGSWFFLGSIFTTLDLEPDERETDHCGSCSNCLDICPTDAFPAPYQLDARRCISYLTIENKGPIPGEFRKAMGNRVFGCDDCLAVCPWNKFATEAREVKLSTPDEAPQPLLSDFLSLDDAAFRARFAGSPVKRIGRDRFTRNCLIAAGNSETISLIPVIEQHLADTSPIVRGAAVWALGELVSDAATQYSAARDSEADADVLCEWNAVAKQ